MTSGGLLQSIEFTQELDRLREELPSGHLAVTSARGGEGVTTVALGLARALAARGPLLLAEGQLRHPALAQRLDLPGLCLADWDRAGPLPVQALPGVPGATVLCAGRADMQPVREDAIPVLLAAAAQRARADFAQVLWDTPPLIHHPDLLVLAPHIDGVIVVVEMDGSRVDELRFLREVLARARIPIVGSLLNRTGRYWPRSRRRHAVGLPR